MESQSFSGIYSSTFFYAIYSKSDQWALDMKFMNQCETLSKLHVRVEHYLVVELSTIMKKR